jgi:hypothetical protein
MVVQPPNDEFFGGPALERLRLTLLGRRVLSVPELIVCSGCDVDRKRGHKLVLRLADPDNQRSRNCGRPRLGLDRLEGRVGQMSAGPSQ